MRWCLITGEYPPQPGGVSDYTARLANALVEAGDAVEVWAPFEASSMRSPTTSEPGVVVHRLPDHFGIRGLRVLGRHLRSLPRDARVLVQYVPQMYGYKAMNVGFAIWLRSFAPRYWIMFHEIAFDFALRQKPAYNVLASATHLMASLAVSGADEIFTSVPAWAEMLRRRFWVRRPIHWLPVPSNLPTEVNPDAVRAIRQRLLPDEGGATLGHFGTFGGGYTEKLMQPFATALRVDRRRRALMIGRGSNKFVSDFLDREADLQGRIEPYDGLPAAQVAEHLAACDLLVQPYLDGISSRRGSAMAGLALGRPILTTEGPFSERLWRENAVVELVGCGDDTKLSDKIETLLASPCERESLGRRGFLYYKNVFDWPRVVAQLRSLR